MRARRRRLASRSEISGERPRRVARRHGHADLLDGSRRGDRIGPRRRSPRPPDDDQVRAADDGRNCGWASGRRAARERLSGRSAAAEDSRDAEMSARRARQTICWIVCSTRACCRATRSRPTSRPSTSSARDHRPTGAEMEFAPSQGLNVALVAICSEQADLDQGKQYTSARSTRPSARTATTPGAKRRLYRRMQPSAATPRPNALRSGQRRGDLWTAMHADAAGSFGPTPALAPPTRLRPSLDRSGALHAGRHAGDRLRDPRQAGDAGPAATDSGSAINPHPRACPTRQHLLVSNTGPKHDGYDYCTKCGRIEASVERPRRFASPTRSPTRTTRSRHARVSRHAASSSAPTSSPISRCSRSAWRRRFG